MKILYILTGNIKSASGVFTKVVSQIEGLNQQGLETTGLIFLDAKGRDHTDTEHVKFVALGAASEYEAIGNYIAPMPFDYIYMRYSFATKELLDFCKRFHKKVLFEHNAKEAEEFASSLKEFKRKDLLYVLRHPFSNEYTLHLGRLRSEKKYAKQVLQQAKLGICVTNEIADFQKKKLADYQTATIPNGIKVSDFNQHVPPPYDGTNLRMVLISGHENNWHGVDRLLEGMARYKGKVNFTLKLIGLFQPEVKKQVKELGMEKEVLFFPLLDKQSMNKELEDCHLGIGHLAFFRKKLNEGAVLKVREYLARGIPYIVSHKEVDVEETAGFKPFYLKVSHTRDPVEMESVAGFVESVYKTANFSRVIRQLAQEYIDISVKMKDLANAIRKADAVE